MAREGGVRFHLECASPPGTGFSIADVRSRPADHSPYLGQTCILILRSVPRVLPSCPRSPLQSSDHRSHTPTMPHDSTDPTPPSKSISDNELESLKSTMMASDAQKAIDSIIPKFSSKEEQREYLKHRLAQAFRIFGYLGYDEGVAGHITIRVSDCGVADRVKVADKHLITSGSDREFSPLILVMFILILTKSDSHRTKAYVLSARSPLAPCAI